MVEPNKESFSNEPSDDKEAKSKKKKVNQGDIVDELRNMLSNLSSESSEKSDVPPIDSAMVDGDSPAERAQQQQHSSEASPELDDPFDSDPFPLGDSSPSDPLSSNPAPGPTGPDPLIDDPSTEPQDQPSDSEFWKGNVLGWTDEPEGATEPPDDVAPPEEPKKAVPLDQIQSLSKEDLIKPTDAAKPARKLPSEPDVPQEPQEEKVMGAPQKMEPTIPKEGDVLGAPDEEVTDDPGLKEKFEELQKPKEKPEDLVPPSETPEGDVIKTEPPSQMKRAEMTAAEGDLDAEIESLRDMFPKSPDPDLEEPALPTMGAPPQETPPKAPPPTPPKVPLEEEREIDLIQEMNPPDMLPPKKKDPPVEATESMEMPEVPIPETVEEKKPKEEGGIDFAAEQLKPANIIHISCVYPEGKEAESEEFVNRLKAAGLKARKPLDIQPVFLQAWSAKSFDIFSWEKSAELSGSTFMFVLVDKAAQKKFKKKVDEAKGENWQGRVLLLERIHLKSIYTDLISQLSTIAQK